MSIGSIADWFAAAGTIMTGIIAVYIATIESRRQKENETKRQAEMISAFPFSDDFSTRVLIINNSKLPIYNAVISYGICYGAGEPFLTGNDNQLFIKRVPPGKYISKEPKNPGGGMHTQTGISISFRDSNGKFWRRDATGTLKQTTNSPFEEMKVKHPISNWAIINPTERIEK